MLTEQDIKKLVLGDCEVKEVEKAKKTINNIVTYYHNEVTHPDEVHEECVAQLPCWQCGGSEMKQIQKDYKVKMYIPRESANQNVVVLLCVHLFISPTTFLFSSFWPLSEDLLAGSKNLSSTKQIMFFQNFHFSVFCSTLHTKVSQHTHTTHHKRHRTHTMTHTHKHTNVGDLGGWEGPKEECRKRNR